MSRAKVVVVQRHFTQYRVALFEHLRALLADEDIELVLLVGQGHREELARDAEGHLDWAVETPTRYFLNGKICWQPLGRHLKGASLVVIVQENKSLYNHLMLMRPRGFKLAFWGHGKNMQSDKPEGLKEGFKRWTTGRVDWWFAYTQMTVDILKASGFPVSRITNLNNAIDTSTMRQHRQIVTANDLAVLRSDMQLNDKRVGVFIGSLAPYRRLDFLFGAAQKIRETTADFHLLVIGDGVERGKVQQWMVENSWVRWVGARRDVDKVRYLSLGDVMLVPGAVGLNVVDSFIMELPLVTTELPTHGPEFSYIVPGQNGLVTADSIDNYAESVVSVFQDPELLARLRSGCGASAAEYTVENMAARFADGILNALELPSCSVARRRASPESARV